MIALTYFHGHLLTPSTFKIKPTIEENSIELQHTFHYSLSHHLLIPLTLFINWLVRFCSVFTVYVLIRCIALERHCLNLVKYTG